MPGYVTVTTTAQNPAFGAQKPTAALGRNRVKTWQQRASASPNPPSALKPGRTPQKQRLNYTAYRLTLKKLSS